MIRTLTFVVAAGIVLAACSDPFELQWQENPQEYVIYSLDRDEVFRESAFNMFQRTGLIVEDPGSQNQWDFALDRQGGQMVFLPPSALDSRLETNAGIAVFPNMQFQDVREAPADTSLYSTRDPVPVELGTVYVVRTHTRSGVFGEPCSYYGKVEPLEIHLTAGVLRFRFDVSPDCNNLRLVPPGG